jgi:hypothetical protein
LKLIQLCLIATFTLFAVTGFAAPAEKVDICHFDEEFGVWELINISGNAIPAHLANHDDAFPEQTTGVTGTYLDENCEAVPDLPDCGDCLIDNGTPGCEVDACEIILCDVLEDPFCCGVDDGYWDDLCAEDAAAYCQGEVCN